MHSRDEAVSDCVLCHRLAVSDPFLVNGMMGTASISRMWTIFTRHLRTCWAVPVVGCAHIQAPSGGNILWQFYMHSRRPKHCVMPLEGRCPVRTGFCRVARPDAQMSRAWKVRGFPKQAAAVHHTVSCQCQMLWSSKTKLGAGCEKRWKHRGYALHLHFHPLYKLVCSCILTHTRIHVFQLTRASRRCLSKKA